MDQNIRYAIFALEIFNPMSNSGRGIESMILSSKHLEKYSVEEIEKEIELMKAEGLIDQRNPDDDPKYDAWWSTEKGQIEVQRLKATHSYMSDVMAEQEKYAVADLILALFAAPKVTTRFQRSPHHTKTIGIYLFDKNAIEIATALDSLVADGYLSTEWEELGMSGPTLTAKGLQHYKTTVHSRLGLIEGQSIFDPKSTTQLDQRFEKLGLDPKLAINLQRRWLEAELARDSKAFLASVTMLGGILEGIFYAVFNKYPKAPNTAKAAPRDSNGSIKHFDEWKLNDMINVAVEIDLVSKAVSKHSHELRDSRNLIHPHKQITENFEVDEGLVKISFEVVNSVLDSLIKKNL